MSYATKSDIENIFGTANVLRWSNLSTNATTADADRIGLAIAVAEGQINDAFRGSRYAVPLRGTAGLPAAVRDWAAKLAGVWLYESRGFKDGAAAEDDDKNRVRRHRTDAMTDMRAYLCGARQLECVHSRPQPDSMQVIE